MQTISIIVSSIGRKTMERKRRVKKKMKDKLGGNGGHGSKLHACRKWGRGEE